MNDERPNAESATQAPDAPRAGGDSRETVAFIRSSRRESAFHSAAMHRVIVANAAGAALVLIIRFAGQFLRFYALADVLCGLISFGVSALTLFILIRAFASSRISKEQASSELPESADEARIRCVGRPTDLGGELPLDDRFFEPVIVHDWFWFGGRLRGLMSFVAGLIGLACMGAAWWVQYRLGGVFRAGRAPELLYTGAFVALAAIYSVWPAHIRIVPGRLDVLHFFAFRKAPIDRRSCDLKTARILVDLPRGLVFIDAPVGPKFEFPLWPRKSGRRLAYYILLAAISTHQPGPLPEDELLG